MSTALVLNAQLDPLPGPSSSTNTLRGQHSMPAPSSSSSPSPNHWSAPPTTTAATQHYSAAAYSTYSSPAYQSPHQIHHLPPYSSPTQQQSHLSYASYNGSYQQTQSHGQPQQQRQQQQQASSLQQQQQPQPQHSSEPPSSGVNARAGLSYSQADSPVHSPQVPASSGPGLSSSNAHASSATTGGLNIAGMLNQPVTTAVSSHSSYSYASRYGSNQHTPASHGDHQGSYFSSAPNGSVNEHVVSPTLPAASGPGPAGTMPAYKSSSSYMHPSSHSYNHSHSNIPVSTPGSYHSHSGYTPTSTPGSYHSHGGGHTPTMTSQAGSHPGLHTPGLSTGVSGMGISPNTGLGVPVYSHLPMGNRHRVTTTVWEDENTLCFQVDAKGVCVARRNDNNMINGTKLLNVCGMTRGKRDGILKNEKERIVVKVGAMHLKGVWINFERAKHLAEANNILDILYPLFEHNLQDFLYQTADYPRQSLVMQNSAQERNAQRPRLMGPMSGVPASTSSMSPPLSIPSTTTMPSHSIASTLSMSAYSNPAAVSTATTTYPGLSSVTHPPLMRSQTAPSFAMPLPRQSPVVTSSPSGGSAGGGWGQSPPISTDYHTYSAPASTYSK